MEHKIPTLYTNYDEVMLDIDIYGRKVLSPHLSILELRDRLFEDFKRNKPLPTLTSRRYDLSRLVSEDYKILYIKELELKTNEQLIDLRENSSSKKEFNFNFDNLEPIATNIKSMFTYESRTTDLDRERILEKYDLFSGEEFSRGIAETEKLFGSVKEDKSLIKTDEEIDQMGIIKDDESDNEFNESHKFEYHPVEDTDDSSLSEDYNYSSLSDSTEVINVQSNDYLDEDEDDDYPIFDDEDDTELENSTAMENENNTFIDEDDDYPSFDEDDDDYPDFDDDTSEDGLDDDYPDFDNEEDTDYNLPSTNKDSSNEIITGRINSVDEDFSDFDMEFEEPKLDIPKTPAELNIIKPVEEKIDRSSEPTDIRQFLRKHPRSTMDFVLKYFTKKQVNDALKLGRIIKKGNILKLP